MLKLTVLAVAFATGVTTFAARAEDITMHGEKVAAMRAEMRAALREKAAKAGASKKVAGERTDKSKSAAKPGVKATAPKQKPKAVVAKAKSKPAAKAASRVVATKASGKASGRKPSTASAAIKPSTASAAIKKVADAVAVEAIASAAAYGPIVSRYASTYGVPVSLANAVIHVESNYRPEARGRAGEIGLMQIKPATARMMGYSGSNKELFNPETNIKFGMKYLAKAHELGGGTTCGTILKYNAGHAAKRMNPVSSAYCSKVMQRLAAN